MKNLVPSLLPMFLLLPLTTMILTGCPSSKNPSSPAQPTPSMTSTPTATLSPTPVPGIYWNEADLARFNIPGTTSIESEIFLTVNGQPLTNVNAVLSSPALSSPVTIPYSSPSTIGGVIFAHFICNCPSLTYQPGQTYTLTTTSGILTASSSLVAPGGITNASDGSQASWSVNGTDYDDVYVYNSTSAIYIDQSATSPFSLPTTAYSGPSPYYLLTQIGSLTYTITGGSTLNGFKILDSLKTTVTLPTPTFTPTGTIIPLTSTPTSSPSPTFSNTATYSTTFTPTSTSTNSLTNTPTPSSTHTMTFTRTPTITGTPTPSATPPSLGVTLTISNDPYGPSHHPPIP